MNGNLLIALVALPWLAVALGFALPKLAEAATLVMSLVLVGMALPLAGAVTADGPVVAVDGVLRLDALGAWTLLIVVVLGAATSFASISHLRHEHLHRHPLGPRARGNFHALIAAFIGTMVAVPVCDHLGALWIAVEATTLSSVFLVGIERTTRSIEAAWKYLIICTVGLGFALMATAFLAAAAPSPLSGTSASLSWSAMRAVAGRLDPRFMRFAFALALIGYGAKAGLAPMHAWLPDAHSQSPSPVSGLLSGALLQVALYTLVRFRSLAVPSIGSLPNTLLVAFGLLSLGLAAFFLIVQVDIKRLLAYSSVEHVGLMAIGLGLGSFLGAYAALLHNAAHALAKGLAFFAAGDVVERARSRRLPRLRGAFAVMPWSATLFLLALLALAGLPPFGIFTAEFLLLRALFASGRLLLGFGVTVLLGLAFAGMVYQAATCMVGEPGHILARGGRERFSLTAAAGVIMILVLLGLGLGLAAPVESLLVSAVREALS